MLRINFLARGKYVTTLNVKFLGVIGSNRDTFAPFTLEDYHTHIRINIG